MFTLSLTLLITTITYFEITTIIDLHPFNGVRHYTKKERYSEALRNGIVFLIPIILIFVANRWTLTVASFIMFGIVVGMLLTWVFPYLTGKEAIKLPDNQTWPEVYRRIFADTITILPRRKNPNMPTPNLEHTILFILVISSAITLALYSFHF